MANAQPGNDGHLAKLGRQARALGRVLSTARTVRADVTSAPVLKGSAVVSTRSDSAQHSAGTSKALAKASKFLDALPTCSAVSMSNQRVLDRYLAAIERQKIHRIESHEATEFKQTEEMWRLILLAVSRAESIYADPPYSPRDTVLRPSGHSKKTTISDDELTPNGDHVIVVTVRGSASFSDWLVNVNGAPVPSSQHETPSPAQQPLLTCHKGFQAVARDMEGNVAKAIAEKLDGMPETSAEEVPSIDLLFTGHSAGGAIAKLFYAMSSSSNSQFARVIPRFRRVHCIVFGAPPVVTAPISRPESPPFRSGLFLNMVNERDPIALAQQEYIHLLLQCFVTAQGSNPATARTTLEVPRPTLRLSGTCIVLRDISDKVDHTEWRAVVVAPEVLEGKLFGDPTMHRVDNYVKRLNAAYLAQLSGE